MIPGAVSWLDCFVFLVFLAPQLILRVGFFPTLFCAIQALPFFLVKLPLTLVYERLVLNRGFRSPFVRQASWFEDFIIRCVRYAFAYIPSHIGRVFFSKSVALPFLYFRCLRHGYLHWPIHWHEIKKDGFTGVWMIHDPAREPDIVIYYAHGGGFSMGSSYFYLEFLMTFLSLLKAQTTFHNPAILALEYTLVPDSSYPTQLREAIAGYKHLLSITHDPSKIVISGDSAGATIMMSLLLWLGGKDRKEFSDKLGDRKELEVQVESVLGPPSLGIFISPWTTLHSPYYHDTPSDYLHTPILNTYASQYAASHAIHSPLLSPGDCTDRAWMKTSSPKFGYFFAYGAEEVFAPEIRKMVGLLARARVRVGCREEKGGIHAWVVASLFLSSTREQRLKGLEVLVDVISERLGGAPRTKDL